MEQVVPWKALLAVIEPVYPKAGNGRRPYALKTMLRIHLMQNWFGYSDPAMEEALYEVAPLRRFAGLSLTRGNVPDETTILNFRRLLETHDLALDILATVNAHLSDQGLLLRQGTIMDATIIHAPSSTKAVKHTEHRKAAVRSKVEHSFRLVKRQFGFQKVRFNGLVKNTAHLLTLFVLSNLWMAPRTLLAAGEARP